MLAERKLIYHGISVASKVTDLGQSLESTQKSLDFYMAQKKSIAKSQHLRLEEMMMRFPRTIVFLAAWSMLLAFQCHAQAIALSPQQLIKDVAYNEDRDRQ